LTAETLMTIIVTMKPRVVPAGEFKAKCLELMDRVAATGRPVVITKRGTPIARLEPAVRRRATLRGFMKGRIEVIGNIVEPIEADWDALR
jgi:prevent-host-death family protein